MSEEADPEGYLQSLIRDALCFMLSLVDARVKSLAVYETVPYQLSLLLAEDNDEKNDAALRIKANWAKMELLERRKGAIGVSFLYDAIPWSRSCFVRESAFLVGARDVGASTTAFTGRLRAMFSSPLSTRAVENGFNVYK